MSRPYAMSVKDAAKEFAIPAWRLYELAQAGAVKRKFITKKRYVVITESVQDWLDRQTDDPELVGA